MSIKSAIQNFLPFGSGKDNPLSDKGDPKRNLSNYITPVQFQRIRQDVKSWREAIAEAELVWYPHRVKMQKIFIDTILNGHVTACWQRRKDLTLLRKWEFCDKNGKIDQNTTEIFLNTINNQTQNKEWFSRFIDYSLDAIAFGYSLISLGDIENGDFKELQIIRRWNVSPDRLNVTNFVYSISGANFMEEPYKNWHVYVNTTNEVGSSICGFGFLYKIALYEIYLRNLLGFNADFTELYAQPYRVGKTTKTDEGERAEFEQILQQMGSNGYALVDPEDEISFIETALGGTGYKGYDNFEIRLEKKITKVILGHADSLDSVPGKLGNDKEKSPAQKAMEDKQTFDGSFISDVVNGILIPHMREIGFIIPDGTMAVLKNDAEIKETNDNLITQAVEMKKGGLQMDSKYFTKQTGIPVTATPEPIKPIQSTDIKNKLAKIYEHNHKH